MKYSHYRGSEIQTILEALAELRIAVFREFPYLYEGTLQYEKAYLSRYVNCKNAMVFAIFDESSHMIGATTCLPLEDETGDIKAPFLAQGLNPADFFYFGESIILPEFRGRGYGHRFFEEREKEAQRFTSCSHCCFCAVDRPDNHSLKPNNYRSLEPFWIKRGYEKRDNLKCQLFWPDLGESKQTAKNLTFWLKNIKPAAN
jgi:GNAT superfamily N-acetyltransferase